MSKNNITEVNVEFSSEDLDDLNKFVSMIRDKTAESLITKTVQNMYGITPSKMTLEERLNFAAEIENKEIVVSSGMSISVEDVNKTLNYENSDMSDMLKASAILEVMGFERLANQMRKRYGEMFVETLMGSLRQIEHAKKVISEDRSKARRGKTNRHYVTALKIAADTWARYPHASLAGLSEDIYSYLRKSWKDVPVAGTVEKWLKESGLNPDVKPKNRNFELIISEGE
ncbi:hypothetical protein [Pectobacterium brasiliense]|uniref:hypothetical protein n=1 Tax=Pectobacterium brasiliense TaxID=180957 RepID=UPI0015DE527C|nr:hypothetical protein [Pectobacterium brasiliense]MBA0208184.1 hypothetical protein [Pectobacterium brasiliense]